ncbi:helix-turn-helix domain-containing protein [Aureimonas psammosilenae]|uniref:hypothetical protein n=1 Tax=Aureimonas psammosilenae TaxID=2495496 RepID=UPI001260D170|nr:hypothetical protein [Aureimonas psammosilenae]
MSHVFDSGQIDRKSSMPGQVNHWTPPMAEAFDSTDPVAVYDDMKARLERMGLNLKGFAAKMGISFTTLPRWRTTMTPPYVLAYLNLLESRSVALPEVEADPIEAMRTSLTAVIDDAIAKGWTRPQIGAALRQLADETDKRRS